MKPKHLKAKKFVDLGLFQNLHNFNQLENRISKLPEHDRGDAFEVFAEAYFATQKLSQAAEIWPDKAIPASIRNNLGLTSRDMGVDGVFRTKEDYYHAYQVKFRSGRTSLTWEELSTFMGISDRVKERVLFTNSTDLPMLMQDRTDFYAVKGNDLEALDKNDFQCIEEWLKSGSFVFKRKDPLPHQNEALTNILSVLSIRERTTAVMACGTGKTLISLWVAERIGVDTILILLPSLSLVRQMLHVWMKETILNDYSFLCVCSDQSVVKGMDEIVLHQSDLNFPVTTDKEAVKKFLTGKSKHKLVFSTYHSSKVVADGLPQGFSFDLGIFDEAHKTAGREGTSFSFALKNENLPIAKRLFLTATPRHYDVNKRNKEGDPQLVFSMDDQEIYGSISHKLSFASAAALGIICKYKIVISAVTEEMIGREVLKRGEVIVNGDIVKANQIARALAMKNAIEEYGVKRIFTFHSSVKAAKSFTSPSGEGVAAHLDDFFTFHVNGEMPTNRRELIMREFEEAPKALMSNARCLTEGVDVPAVDMVAFMSPKKSRVDITQAVGRAMRKAPGKECGYIFLPIFLEVAKGENIETALEKTQFQEVWDVLEAMQEQDECLAEIIRKMREDVGRKKGFDDSLLRERLELIGPGLELDHLRKAITIKLITTLGALWDERYGELVSFKENNNHCNVPQDYPENQKLSNWVGSQRTAYRDKKISQERINKLQALGFEWDPRNAAWDKMFTFLCEFKKVYQHCNVPESYDENLLLFRWVRKQRDKLEIYKRSDEFQYRIKKLDELGFDWDPFHNAWEEMYSALCKFKEINGHCNVSKEKDHKQLGSWVMAQRSKFNKGKLPQERVVRLQEIGFIWNSIEAKWDEMYAALNDFKGIYGHCNVFQEYAENPPLANWVGVQRNTYKEKKISHERIKKLEALGFDWDPITSAWEEMFSNLCKFKDESGHCNVPAVYSEKGALGNWVTHIRVLYKNNTLDKNRIDRLEKIGFDWDPITSAWEEMYSALGEFKKLKGHCNVPQAYHLNQQLGSWIATQRSKFNKGKLAQERQLRLESIGIIWDPYTASWEVQFAALEKFKAAHNHCNVPKEYPENPPLGAWVSKQRKLFNQKKLSPERIERLEKIGMLWHPRLSRWDKNYNELATFKDQHGHFNILKIHPEKTNLDHWMKTQRTFYKKDKLSKERVQKLEAINFVWDPLNTEWEALYTALCDFQKQSGHCKVPARYPLNKKLATWVSLLRMAFHEGKLTQEKITRLQMIGFDWDPFETAWGESFIKLCQFKDSNGHMNISSTNITTKPLANWASDQRKQYKIGELSKDKTMKLETLGFIWDPIEEAWQSNFTLLCEFKELYGHCNVPQKSEDNAPLAAWVNRQKTEYKKKALSSERVLKLEKIGIVWDFHAKN